MPEYVAPPFTINFFLELVESYCEYVLPTVPIISGAEFKSAIESLAHSSEHQSLVYSLAAQTLNLTRTQSRRPSLTEDDATTLYSMALSSRRPVLSQEQITVRSIMVPLLASIGMFATDRDTDMGYYYNREAITGIQILRVDDAQRHASFSREERTQRERLHWLLFIHDRFHSIFSLRPAVLPVLSTLPEPDTSLTPSVSEWFNELIRLFRVVDDDFIRNWLDKSSTFLTLEWIEKKQAELGGDTNTWSEGFQTLTDMQQVDLTVTRHWLCTLVWQMALRKFVLKSNVQPGRDLDFLSLTFPIRLSHQLRHCLLTKHREAVEVHGTGILQKIFDITCTVADLLQYVVPRTCSSEVHSAHVGCFLFLYEFLLKMSKFYHVERAVLTAKFEAVQAAFPGALGENLDSSSWSHGWPAAQHSYTSSPPSLYSTPH